MFCCEYLEFNLENNGNSGIDINVARGIVKHDFMTIQNKDNTYDFSKSIFAEINLFLYI